MEDDDDMGVTGAQTLCASPDPHGQAAMLLVESLLHGLIARSVITVGDAVEMVNVACDVKAEIGEELGDTPQVLHKSLSILSSVAFSLRTDLVGA